ncbi:5-oxoprolinase subunit PxpB [Pseudidiomarina homiensis]|uniref:Allophanate hydrolase n=1 Tax=Pseudidiomarina homiensis TaxID=364198 RepID=A0A432Y3D1_9GAMM|nr:5-oxoprolinase subunit PxpB [Pseudidiomarina homiensis]RUO55464.1 allophanate hydrolase [Pseudidiomarina homiensis]
MNWQFQTAAPDALMLVLEERIDLQVNRAIQRLARELADHTAVQEVVPSYHTLLIYYDVLEVNEKQLRHLLEPVVKALLAAPDEVTPQQSSVHTIAVCYHPEVAADLEAVAAATDLSVEAVAELHSGTTYHVYALGFAPGFAYLGDVPEQLRLPRHSTPRQKVPKGSVAIAGQQTAIYPRTSPGGWQLIGRAVQWPELQAGDRVRFEPISLAEFRRMNDQESSNG